MQDEIQHRSSIEKDPWFSRVAATAIKEKEEKVQRLQERRAESHAHTQTG